MNMFFGKLRKSVDLPYATIYTIKTSIEQMLSHYFGEHTQLKKEEVIAKILKEAKDFPLDKFNEAQQTWLHERLFKVASEILDPQKQLVRNDFWTLSSELQALANLQCVVHVLQADLRDYESRKAEKRFSLKT